MPDHYIGGGATVSSLHPAVLAAMLVTAVLMWLLPRKHVAIPFLAITFLTPMAQQIYIVGVHLFVLRILIVVGWTRIGWERIAQQKPMLAGRLTKVDKFFLAWALVHSIAVILLWRSGAAVINQVGVLWNVIGGYFLLRFLIRDTADIRRLIKTLAVITAILGMAMLNEKLRLQNVFGYLGQVPIVPDLRDGHVRAQGPFMHPLLAGSFGATSISLFIWLWYSTKARALAVAGALGGAIMAVTCACSTPLMAGAAGVAALFVWPARRRLRVILWGFVALLAALQLVMKAPVWFLMARIDLAGGSSGYHRAMLIDTFLRHFWDWWLIGTRDAFNWGWDMWDTCNQYIQEGEGGGIVALVCFVLMIAFCFKRLGKAMRRAHRDRKQDWPLWILGAALFSHVVGFFGIAYFDQTQMVWFFLLASIVTATSFKKTVVKTQAGTLAARQVQVAAPAHTCDPEWAGRHAHARSLQADSIFQDIRPRNVS
jgi:hypothetical protein